MAKKKTNKFLWIVFIAVVVVALVGAYFYYQSANRVSANYPGTNTGVNTQLPTNTGGNTGGGSNTNGGDSIFIPTDNYDIAIKSYTYDPQEITIKVGNTIKWTNMDNVQHTITSNPGKELNSTTLNKGDSYSHTFDKAGVYYYYCTFHPSMQGKITVE